MMSRISRKHGFAGALAFAVVVSACASPPQEVIDTAAQAEEAAMASGAQEYAPEAVNAVMDAKAALEAELAVQSERMALTRSYGRAEELAVAYQSAAEAAAAEAAAGRQKAEEEATLLLSDGRMALDDAREALATAPRGKGSAADLAAMQADLDAAGTTLTEAEAALQAGAFLEAQTKAMTAIEAIARIREAVSQAEASGR